jgi:Nuclease-related domain
MDLKGTLIFIVYAALFIGVPVGVVWWDRYNRRTRKPFGEDARLLRMPGEYLLRRVIEYDASAMQWTFGLMVVPVLAGAVALQILPYFLGKTYTSLVIGLVVFVSAIVQCIWWLVKRLKRRQDDYLGFFGERIVADCLEPLKEKGWFIFHDLQCVGATGPFNLDHVAVGPGGIWVIETKTWRKGNVRPGMKDYEVTFDGTKIIWPHWDDSDSVGQASNNARWLQDWLKQMPEIKCALPRGFDDWRPSLRTINPGRRSRTRLPRAIFGRPSQGFQLVLRRVVKNSFVVFVSCRAIASERRRVFAAKHLFVYFVYFAVRKILFILFILSKGDFRVFCGSNSPRQYWRFLKSKIHIAKTIVIVSFFWGFN